MTEENKTLQSAIGADVPFTSAAPAAEAEFDEYLMSVASDEEEFGVGAELDPKDDPIGTGVKEPSEIKETPETDTGEGDDGEQPGTAKDPDTELESALVALKRDGLSQSVIDKMTNEEVLALGTKRAKVQGDTDNAYRELQELKSGKEMAHESGEDSPVQAEPAEQPSPVDLKTAIEPFVETFGEEAGESLEKALHATVQPVLAQFKAQQDMLEGMLLQSSRQSLSEQYPSMADDEAYGRVSERMQILVKSGEYHDINLLMADAARLEFADESAAVSNQFKSKLARDKAGGKMMPSGKANTPETSMADDEREDALLDALENGMDLTDAKRLYGSTQPSL